MRRDGSVLVFTWLVAVCLFVCLVFLIHSFGFLHFTSSVLW